MAKKRMRRAGGARPKSRPPTAPKAKETKRAHQADPKARKRATKPADTTPVLLLLLIPEPTSLAEIVPELIDLGIRATAIETKGLAALLRENLPMFSGVAAMLPEAPAGRLLICLTAESAARKVLALLAEHKRTDHPPLGIILKVQEAA